MKKIAFLLFAALMLMLLGTSSTTFAGKVYKWVDSNGKVHYGERAPSGNAKQINIPRSKPYVVTPNSKPANKMDATNKFLESIAAERKEKKEATDKLAKEKATTDKNCSNARKRVASLKQGGRRFTVDEQGERHYMDGAEIQSKLKEAQKRVQEWCK